MPPASMYMITAGHGPLPSGLKTCTGHCPSRVRTLSSSCFIHPTPIAANPRGGALRRTATHTSSHDNAAPTADCACETPLVRAWRRAKVHSVAGTRSKGEIALHPTLVLLACLASAASVAAAPAVSGAAKAAPGTANRERMVQMHDADARPWMDARLSPDQRAELVLKAMTQDEKFRLLRTEYGDSHPRPAGALGSAGYQPAIARLGLPAIQESDAGLGVD